jgi:N-acetylglucosamine-6-phosphate deacetylase
MNSYHLKNITVFLENKVLKKGNVIIENGIIKDIFEKEKKTNFKTIFFDEEHYLTSGFIDMHIHGAFNIDSMDKNGKLDTLAKALLQEGTTSFLATTMTASYDDIEKALLNIANHMKGQKEDKAQILGVNLEGPFIAKEQAKAQNKKDIVSIDIARFTKWKKICPIKVVTFAPESKGANDFIIYLIKNKIKPSIGHTNASYEKAKEAILKGANHFTHLFNGMSGLDHRHPGATLAALLDPEVSVELIVDGLHIHPAMIDLVVRLKKNKIILITDSMRAKYMKDGFFDLGGQEVIVRGNKASLKDGTLAGSMLKMNEAVKNMVKFTNISLFEAFKMASEYPAKKLNIFKRKGSVAKGKDADLVILDKNLNVINTFCHGHILSF